MQVAVNGICRTLGYSDGYDIVFLGSAASSTFTSGDCNLDSFCFWSLSNDLEFGQPNGAHKLRGKRRCEVRCGATEFEEYRQRLSWGEERQPG